MLQGLAILTGSSIDMLLRLP